MSYRSARRASLAQEDDEARNEISFAGPEMAASRQLGAAADEGELWERLRLDAERAAAGEEMLRGFLDLAVLRHETFTSGFGPLLARKLAEDSMPVERLGEIARSAMAGDPTIVAAAIADLIAVRTRDPAAESYLKPFLYYKGFHALQWHRIGHWLWRHGRRELAYFLQSRVSEVFAIDIHPAVPIGSGVFIDHGTGLVVGETAVIGDNVSILHEVTLGGTGKERGDRHPKVRDGVLLCAGAKVLGNVEIGRDAKVGAGSVVLHDVPARATVAGVPARIVGWSSGSVPALEMDQSLPDYEI
jgi:serine O-acetyltransferase